ncbi:MAG: TonB-dependent receptor [Bacteroidetes bacterium]|nr:MAG: TonB-dependent receptor [Bacteroidota bacterium]
MFSKIIIFLSFLSLTIQGFSEQRYHLRGSVRDASTGEYLAGVNIFIPEIDGGAVTDIDGKYSIRLSEREYTLIFSFIGYQRFERKIVMDTDKTLDVFLQNGGLRLSEVVVSAERSGRNLERAEMSTVTLDIESIRNLPAFLGEVDVLRTIQLLPGVQSAGDGNTGFFVRGGNADQNLVLLDDAVVFNASHLFNFFSVFNPDAIQDVKLYKGGILPEYGGRLSSVLDVGMKQGSMNQYNLSGGLGLISSRLTVDGPIQYGRSAFLFSGRRTYADLFLKLSSDEAQRESQLFFYDLNGKMNYVLNDQNRLFFSGYYGRDVTVFGDFFSFDWGNATSSMRWNRIYNGRMFSDFSILYSNYQFNIAGDVGPASFRWQSYLHNLNLKADFNYIFNNNNTFTFGLQSIYHNLDPGIIKARIEGAAGAEFNLSATNALEHGIYFNNEQSLFNNRLLLVYGLRNSVFQLIGPGNQYVFDKTDPLQWEVTDTLQLERGNFYDEFINWEPRFSFRLKLNERSSVKGSYNRMVQYIQQAQSAQSVAPYDVWYSVSNNIPPQIADQVALGYFRNFLDNRIETSIELYYKDMQNVSDVVDNGDILGNELVEGQLRIGRGWAYGAEFLLQKQTGRLSGFLGYTWAVAKRQIDDINEGKAYFAPNDRRHDLSMSGSYEISKAFNVGMSFIYATGTAITLPVGKMFYQGAFAPIYSDRNSGRLPDYHRLDLSVTFTPNIRDRERRRFESSWNFSLFNVYGRVNPISVSFAENSDRPGVPNSSFFYIPGPIPAITWNFNF